MSEYSTPLLALINQALISDGIPCAHLSTFSKASVCLLKRQISLNEELEPWTMRKSRYEDAFADERFFRF
jgi:hypothetical protein